LTRRTTLAVGTMFRRTNYLDTSAIDFGSLTSSLTFMHQIYRKLTIGVSYTRDRQYSSDPRISTAPISNLNLMINYGDATTFQLARRTTLAVNASAASVRNYRGQNQYTVLGGVMLTHSMRRTWSANAQYMRTLGFQATFREAVLQDTVTGMIGGQLSRRTSVTGTAGIARGYLGLNYNNSFDTVSVLGMLRIAFNRRIGFFTQYSLYDVSLPANSTTIPLLPRYRGHNVVVGVNLFAPLYNNPRVRQ
jgi:hypothetical protein